MARTILFWGTVALAGLMVVLVALGRCTPIQLIPGAAGVAYAALARVLIARAPGNAVAWIVGLLAVVLILAGLTDGYLESEPGGPAFDYVAWLGQFVWSLWLPGLVAIALPLTFPDGRPYWPWVAWLGAGGTLVAMAGTGFMPGPMETRPPVDNPFGIETASGVLSMFDEIGFIATSVAAIGAGAALIVRLRRSRGVERQQLKWFAYVAVLVVVGFSMATVGSTAEDATWAQVLAVVWWFTALAMAGFGIPIATAFAILRHRLYEIDVVIKRTLVYGALTATLGAAYVACVLVLQFVFSPSSDFAIAASTLAVAALFRPARNRIQAAVNRRFYRRSYDAARTVESFGARLREQVSLETLSDELRGVVHDTVQPSHVSVWLKEPAR
jgi:hypothetical protein